MSKKTATLKFIENDENCVISTHFEYYDYPN